MADGDHSLPSNEELFGQQPFVPQQEQPVGMEAQQANQQQHYELAEQIRDNTAEEGQQQFHGVPQDPQVSGVVPMNFATQNHQPHYELMEPHDHYYPDEEQHQIRQPPANSVFQPAAYVPPASVAPQPRETGNFPSDQATAAGDQPNGEQAEESGDEEEAVDMAQFDANEHTVWIDSDGDEETEELILKQNFYLPYSDHNYDCADPSERVIHPQEGPFPIIEGLDEEGNVVRQYMPQGYEDHGEEIGGPTEEEKTEREQDLEQERLRQPTQVQMQQSQQYMGVQAPHIIQQQPIRRPVNTVPPFPGGNHVDYGEPPRLPRGLIPAQQLQQQQQFRSQHEYGSPLLAGHPRGVSVQHQNNRTPGAMIVRPGQRPGQPEIYQQMPRGAQPPAQRVAALTPQPGSYQHVMNPMPGGGNALRRSNPQNPQNPQLVTQQPTLRGTPIGSLAGMRPIGRPLPQPRQIIDMQEREFVEHPLPLPQAAPVRRVIGDVPPHRMTQEQRHEQQMNRPRAQFPMQQRAGVRPAGMQGPLPVTTVPAQGTVIGRRLVGTPGAPPTQEELTRSPQRPPPLEPRRFQVKVTDTYSTPIPKASDQLPAQLTEDPDEPSTSGPPPAPPKEDEPEAEGTTEEAKIKSPARIASANSSPIKPQNPQQHGGLQKPTPPHRMTQEEKNAHFAKLEKEKPTVLAPVLPSSSQPSSSSTHPHHHHQPPPLPPIRTHQPDDPLSVVQSVFDNSKPREPDTPKDKEEISKIASELKFSADKFSGNQQRQRTISGGRGGVPYHPMQHQQQPMQHHPHLPTQQHLDMMNDGRKRQISGSIYDRNLSGQVPSRPAPPPPPPHLQNQLPESEARHRHPEAGMEPQHRPRGRPRGSTGPQRNRWPSGGEPAPPHRAAGGARTLQPRQPPTQPARNGAPIQNNSDSESEGIEGEGEESWEMRCHCGMDHGDGETIECEGCKTWQHMACMGMDQNSDTSKYKCEMCLPRKLKVTKNEAIRAQKKILERIIKATEAAEKKKREKQRRSEPADSFKKQQPVQQPSTSRKSAPMVVQVTPSTHRVPQLNEYSKAAANLLKAMPQTAGADTLLEESRRHKKARRMFVEEHVEALVTTEVVAVRSVILEVNGYVAMASEMKRIPGGGNHIFMYDGLMKGTSGEEMGNGQELVCIDAKKKGNDTKYTRRSCQPNCVLKHVLGTQATLGIMVVATKDIHRNVEVTLPFDVDWRDSDVQLECAEHMKGNQACPFETERRRYAAERHRSQELERLKADDARRVDEERRRLEDEVRRERAAKTKQMDEEAEQERLAQEKAKKAEREEARKKKEAEKAEKKKEAERKEAEEKEKRDAEEKTLAEKKADERRKGEEAEKQKEIEKKKKAEEEKKSTEKKAEKAKEEAKTSVEQPTTSSRDERKMRNIEEQFRRQEEQEKRREERRSKSQTPTDAPADNNTPSTSGGENLRRLSKRQVARRDSQTSDASAVSDFATPSATLRASKRMTSVTPTANAPSTKRHRASTVDTAADNTNSRKRGATSSSSTTVTPAAKRSKRDNVEHPPISDFKRDLARLAECGLDIISKGQRDFKLPDFGDDFVPVSEWAKKMKAPKKENQEKDAEHQKRKMAEADEKLKKAKLDVLKDMVEPKPDVVPRVVEGEIKEKTPEPSSSAPVAVAKTTKSVEKPKTPAPEVSAPKTSAPKASAPEVQTPKIAKVVAPAPQAPKVSTPAPTPKEAVPSTPKISAPAPKGVVIPTVSTPKAVAPVDQAPVSRPPPNTDFHGMEREASMSTEGSVEKELTPVTAVSTAATGPSTTIKTPAREDKKNPKKITMDEYNARRKKQEPSSSNATSSGASSATPAPARRGFIPSTEGSDMANVKLSAIPLDDHPSNMSSTTTTAPSGSHLSGTITSPSRTTRARGAPSESDEPAEHIRSIRDRISDVFGFVPPIPDIIQAPTVAATPPAQPQQDLAPRSRQRPTRWQ